MTSFATINLPLRHSGVARAEAAPDALIAVAGPVRQGVSGTRALATLLLSAMAAAIMVVAYQVMDSMVEGHLLVMWIALWAVAFAALALFAGAARNLAARLKAALDGWSLSMAQARADQRLWALAQSDPRVMADLQVAMAHHEAEAEAASVPVSAQLQATRKRLGASNSAAVHAFYHGCYY